MMILSLIHICSALREKKGNRPDNEEERTHVENGAPCTCCGDRTIPSHKDMISYICPICYWKIDVFLSGEEEPSDENHGLTLKEARENFEQYGVVLPS